MHKLYFKYGTMNSSKTSNLMMVVHNYRSQGKNVIVLKPELDSRTTEIHSRALGNLKVDHIINQNVDFISFDMSNINNKIDCILVDEAQFLSKTNVKALRLLTHDCPVICYGLKTNYMGELFEGSKALLELSDSIEEIKTICSNCTTKKATINARYIVDEYNKDQIITEGNEIDVGSEDKYKVLCWSCWNSLTTKRNKFRNTLLV